MLATVQIAYILSYLDNLVTCTPSTQILPWQASPVPRLTPSPDEKQKQRRAWYRFACDIAARRLSI